MTESKTVDADFLGSGRKLARTVIVGVCAESADFAKVSHEPSVSSFSRSAASACTTPLEMELSIPRFVAKSPALVKAKIAIDAASKLPSLPRLFMLRGTQQTRPRHSDNNGDIDRTTTAAVVAKVNPRPPLHVIIRAKAGVAEGYSPRLRMMSGEGSGVLGGVNAVVTKPNPAMLDPSAAGRAAVARCLLSTVRASNGHATTNASSTTTVVEPQPCVYPETPMCEAGFENDERRWIVTSGGVADLNGQPGGGDVTHTKAPPQGNPPATSTKMHRLCGRLWTGTTANLGHRRPASCRGADPTKRPRRTLFLVSGQGHQQQQQQLQQLDHNTNHSSSKRSRSRDILAATRRHSSTTTRCERGPRPASPDDGAMVAPKQLTTRIANTAPPVVGKTSSLADWNYWEGREHGGDVGDGRDDEEGTLSLPESSAASRSDDDDDEQEDYCYEAATTVGATAGGGGGDGRGGDNSGRRVLHVRVPRAPPTSLLILRSAC